MNRAGYAHTSARTSASPPVVAPAFGVYRAAESSWRAGMQCSIDVLQNTGRTVLRRTGAQSSARLWRGKKSLGATYLERRSMEDNTLSGEAFAKLLRQVGEISTGGAGVEVPIAGLDWVGPNRMVLAVKLADCYEMHQLARERYEIEDALADAGLPHDMVRTPDHVGLCRWKPFPGLPNLFEEKHRSDIEKAATKQLGRASIESVVLDDLIVGNGYDLPYALEDWRSAVEPSDDMREMFTSA